MGIDIRCYVEVKRRSVWECVQEDWPCKGWRNYNAFYFMGHRHSGYAGFPRIVEPRGLPIDCSPEVKADDYLNCDQFSYHSWLTLDELLDYDYDQVVSRQRVITVWEEGVDEPFYYAPEKADEGEWKDFTLREEIEDFIYNLGQLQEALDAPKQVRIVFGFDQEWTVTQLTAMRTEPMCSDAEVLWLKSRWDEQMSLRDKAFDEDWPDKENIRENVHRELEFLRDQETARWEELFSFDYHRTTVL